jgi:hypothetical protein
MCLSRFATSVPAAILLLLLVGWGLNPAFIHSPAAQPRQRLALGFEHVVLNGEGRSLVVMAELAGREPGEYILGHDDGRGDALRVLGEMGMPIVTYPSGFLRGEGHHLALVVEYLSPRAPVEQAVDVGHGRLQVGQVSWARQVLKNGEAVGVFQHTYSSVIEIERVAIREHN